MLRASILLLLAVWLWVVSAMGSETPVENPQAQMQLLATFAATSFFGACKIEHITRTGTTL